MLEYVHPFVYVVFQLYDRLRASLAVISARVAL